MKKIIFRFCNKLDSAVAPSCAGDDVSRLIFTSLSSILRFDASRKPRFTAQRNKAPQPGFLVPGELNGGHSRNGCFLLLESNYPIADERAMSVKVAEMQRSLRIDSGKHTLLLQ